MPTPTSEYRIPIFISSTDYNLKDLRSELAQYLNELGYQPILSSAEGFHDSSPTKEPWESCLDVLSTCPIMLLIIDNRYGAKLPWKNYQKIISTDVSPTHGEYLYAHSQQKRLLVFIREEMHVFYQAYRQAKFDSGGDEIKTREKVLAILPKNSNIEYEVFPFIELVKTTKPIPWIKPFKDVTDLKQEVHKKLLNELAVVFLIKEKQTEVVTSALSTILEESSETKRREILQSMGITRELMENYEIKSKAVSDLSDRIKQLSDEAEEFKMQLIESKKSAQRDENKINELEDKLATTQNQLVTKKEYLRTLRDYTNKSLSGSIYNIKNDDLFLASNKYAYDTHLLLSMLDHVTDARLVTQPEANSIESQSANEENESLDTPNKKSTTTDGNSRNNIQENGGKENGSDS